MNIILTPSYNSAKKLSSNLLEGKIYQEMPEK